MTCTAEPVGVVFPEQDADQFAFLTKHANDVAHWENFRHLWQTMKNLSLRSQVIIIVTVLAISLLGAIFYISGAIGSARENIVRLNRARLSTVTDNLARRFGLVLNFVSETQIEDSSLAQREELRKLLSGISTEELTKTPDVQAGLYHSLWKKEFILNSGRRPKPGDVSYGMMVRAVVQSAVEEQREQWSQHESADDIVVVVAKPVYARGRLVGAAWTAEDLAVEFARSWPGDVTPFLQLAVVIGVLLAAYLIIHLRRSVSAIQHGLDSMKTNIDARLQTSPSELGFIASSINELADTISTQQRERDRLQNTIQQKEKLASLGQLVAGVAHEIRTPLSAIKTRVQLWQRAAKGRNKVTPASMSMVVEELDRIEQLVRKLLFFSKERKLRLRRVDLPELLSSSLRTLQAQLNEHGIDVSTHFNARAMKIAVDESELRQVVLNLLTNAIEAMPEGGKLFVETDKSEDGVTFSIEDTGRGIRQEALGKIFDPFYTTKETGTGLGLSIAYEVVRSHGGTIEYAAGKRRGSRFTVHLPGNGKDQRL